MKPLITSYPTRRTESTRIPDCGTKRGAHPALTATLTPRAGDANIASVSVAFPKSEFLENAHIRTVCTRSDFAASNCPAGAIYGRATATTPLFDFPL